MSTDRLIHDLSAGLQPVRRRRMLREGALVGALGVAELAAFLGLGMMRPDMAMIAHAPFLMWRVGSLGILAVIACTVAIRSFSPVARPRKGIALACALAVLAIVTGLFVAPAGAGDHALFQRIDPAHGVVCAGSIFVLSLPVVAVFGMLLRRGAPTQPGLSAIASGIAAGAVGAFIFAFCCPFNDPLYAVVWYSIGCSAVVAVARSRLPRRFTL